MRTETLTVVGDGFAGSFVAWELHKRNVPFRWISSGRPWQSSRVAYGMVNPVFIRGMAPAWPELETYARIRQIFEKLQQNSGIYFISSLPFYHFLSSEQEVNGWRLAYESTVLFHHISVDLVYPAPHVFIPENGCIQLHTAYRLHTGGLLEALRNQIGRTPETGEFTYDGSTVIWCEGYETVQNPLWSPAPWRPCKGHVLTLESPEIPEDAIYHKKNFLLPLGNHRFLWGSDYKWDTLDPTPEAAECEVLRQEAAELLKIPFTVVDCQAGIRPATADRRPVLGKHPYKTNQWILNGLGSKGLFFAPWCAQMLVNALINRAEVPLELSPQRFLKRFRNAASNG